MSCALDELTHLIQAVRAEIFSLVEEIRQTGGNNDLKDALEGELTLLAHLKKELSADKAEGKGKP